MFEFPIEYVYLINPLLVLLFLFVIYRGYKRGLILQVVDLVGTVVSLFAGWLFSEPLSRALPIFKNAGIGINSIDEAISHQLNRLIWILIIFTIIRLLLLLVTPLASAISKVPVIKQVNSSVGGIFSIVMFAVKIFILTFLLSLPLVKNGSEIVEKSWLSYVEPLSEPVFESLDETLKANDALQSILMKQELSEKQNQDMLDWLQSQNFTRNEIEEFLNK